MNTKERPNCRRIIIKDGWQPNPKPEAWDGKTALTQDGEEVRLTPGFRKQMGKMIQEGHWGKPLPLHKIKTVKETSKERERRLQELCDKMLILDDVRPIPANSGDKLVRVKHAWPWQCEWDWDVADHVAVKQPPFHYVPAWVFEEDNPVSATGRMVFAFLCSRGLLDKENVNDGPRDVGVSKKDIGRALLISDSVAERALLELEDLGIVNIERWSLKFKGHEGYCNFYNANSLKAIEDPGRWARIKTAQTQAGFVSGQIADEHWSRRKMRGLGMGPR